MLFNVYILMHIPGKWLIVTLILKPGLISEPSEENLMKSVFPVEVMASGTSSPHNGWPIKVESDVFPSRTSNQSYLHILSNSKSKARNSRIIFSPCGNTITQSQCCKARYRSGWFVDWIMVPDEVILPPQATKDRCIHDKRYPQNIFEFNCL